LLGGHASSSARGAGHSSLLGRFVYGAAAIAVILFNLLISLEIFNNFEYLHPRAYRRLVRLGDYPIVKLWKYGLVDYGPVRLNVVFPPVEKETIGTLIAAGVPNRTDTLSASQQPGGT